MNNKEYLNEEMYQKSKKKIVTIALIILFIGIFCGSLLIISGIMRSNSINKSEVRAQMNEEFYSNGFSLKYYELKESLDKSERAPMFYILGSFVIFASFIVSSSIYMFSKRREFAAFSVQQVMPIAKEGIADIAPSIGNVAKEITKGIKDGLSDDKKE